MTPQQLAEELERKVAAMNPPASEELAPATVSAQDSRPTVLTGQATAPSPGPVDMTPRTPKPTDSELASPVVVTGRATAPSGGLAGGLPFVAGQPAAAPAPAQQAPDVDTAPSSFADMIMQNDAVRLRNQEAFDRREKADRARLTLASITDALASLGNLVGTTQGSFNQPQTYQVPFVHEDAERARAEARNTANMLLRNDQSLRVAQMRKDSANSAAALRQALEEERTRRAQINNEAKADLETQKQEGRMELEKFKQGGRVSLKQMDIDYKQNKDEMQAALDQQGIRISAGRLAEMVRHNQTIEKIREKGGGGGVGGYETVIIRDEFGREIRRKRVPLGATVDLDDDPAPWTSSGESGGESAPWM